MHSKEREHTIVTATSNPWNSEVAYICMWSHKEKIAQKYSSKEQLTITDLVVTTVLCFLIACTITFLHQNQVVSSYFSVLKEAHRPLTYT